MKKYLTLLPALFAMVFIIACGSSLQVTSDYDKSANFTQYKTFSMFKSEQLDAISELNARRITDAIRSEMTKKGFTETENNPDLFVNAVARLKDKQSVSANTNYYGYGGVYRPYYWGAGAGTSSTTTYDVYDYKEGALMIDVVEASSKKLVWQGVGNKEIDTKVKDPDTKIREAVTSIMKSFPPGKAK
jgi:carbamoylphosphate synthase small subunit